MQANWKDHPIASELYDHQDDLNEAKNLANVKHYQNVQRRLSEVLYQHFTKYYWSSSNWNENTRKEVIISRKKIYLVSYFSLAFCVY